MLINQCDNDNEIREFSLDDICSLILSFISGENEENKDSSVYNSDLSFRSNIKLNTSVDESKEEIHIPSVDSNQNNSNINFDRNNNIDINSIDSNKDNTSSNEDSIYNSDSNNNNKININDKNTLNNNNAIVTAIINPSETSDNENFIYESYRKESTIPYTSSSDDLRILKLDKQSTSDIINFSNLLDAEAHSLLADPIYNDDSKEKNKLNSRKNSTTHENTIDDNFENITDISSIKMDTNNTEKVIIFILKSLTFIN